MNIPDKDKLVDLVLKTKNNTIITLFKEDNLKFKKINQGALAPKRAKLGDAGYDLYSIEDKWILSGSRGLISTGIVLKIPFGFVGLIEDRSSMGVKGIHRLGGVVDSSYLGEVKVILVNLSEIDIEIHKGDKIAQILILPLCKPENREPEEVFGDFDITERNEAGFGSTGR